MKRILQKKNLYFDPWCAHGESWGKVVAYEKSIQRDSSQSSLKEMWLTRAQVHDFFNGPVVGDAIIATKSPPEADRPHPVVPHVKEATQYWVTVDEAFMRSLTHEREKAMSFVGNVDTDNSDMVKEFVAATSAQPNVANAASSATAVSSQEEIWRKAQVEEAEKAKAERKAAAKQRQ